MEMEGERERGRRGEGERGMRLATIQTPSGPRAAIQNKDHFVDLHATDASVPFTVRELLNAGLSRVAEIASRPNAVRIPAAKAKLLAPIPDPRKIICIGLNYRDHAAESGAAIPKEPILFSKFPTALVGHEDSIVLPAVSSEVDYEAELVIVIGKCGRSKSLAEASGCI